MRRREFIALVGGAAVVWPLTARAQPVPVIGFLSTRSPDDSKYLVAAFRQGLSAAGFVEGTNVAIEYRWAFGQYDRLPEQAAELARRPVSLFATLGGEPATLAAKSASSSVPIVFGVAGDPVKLGLAESFNRPGGNATGMSILTTSLEPKRLGLLHELVPRAATVGFLFNANFPLAQSQRNDTEKAARDLGLDVAVLAASTDEDIERAFKALDEKALKALLVAAAPFFDTRKDRIIALVAQRRIPAMYQFREYPVAGGLMSYGIDLPDVYRQVGIYAGRILKGERPGDLPILQPTKFELVINTKTAKALGLAVPSGIMSIADEVIE
jgi:putative ABC transport system substrate-binding protein